MKHIAISTFVIALSVSGAGATQWSYNDCVEYARQHNISLQKARLNEEASSYDLEAAEARWQPTLDFNTSHGFTNSPWNDSGRNRYNSSYGLSAGWTVWDGGQRENEIKRSRLQTQIDRINTGDMMRTIETDILQIYLNILYAYESVNIYEESVKLSDAQEQRARQLMESGRLSRVDYAQLKSQYEQDMYSLVNARGTYETRRMELKKLLELGLDTSLELQDLPMDENELMASLPPMEESYELALAMDLQLRGLELEKEGSEADIAIAKAGSKPVISINGGVGTGYMAPGASFASDIKNSWNENIGLTLSLPILDNKKTKTAVAKSKIKKIEAELDIELRRTELARLVENWYIDTKSAQSKYRAAAEQLEAARIAEELANEKFGLGLVNTIELMTAHNNLVQAKHTLLQAKYMALLGVKMIGFYRSATITLP